MELNNIFEAIPKQLNTELLEVLQQNEVIKIERIVSKGHTSPVSGWYDQSHNEWVIVLKGSAIITFEDDQQMSLQAGSYIDIPAHKKHKVSWTDPQTETVWLAIHY